MLVAEADGRIVGLRAFMRWEFAAGDRRFRAVRAVDTATHPDYQGQGIFSRLTLEALDALRDQADFVFNTPNEKSLPGLPEDGMARRRSACRSGSACGGRSGSRRGRGRGGRRTSSADVAAGRRAARRGAARRADRRAARRPRGSARHRDASRPRATCAGATRRRRCWTTAPSTTGGDGPTRRARRSSGCDLGARSWRPRSRRRSCATGRPCVRRRRLLRGVGAIGAGRPCRVQLPAGIVTATWPPVVGWFRPRAGRDDAWS